MLQSNYKSKSCLH